MDETSVCLFHGSGKGTVMTRKRKTRDQALDGGAVPQEPVQKVSRSMRRTCMTHVGFVCDRPEIQPKLPQVVIGNEHTFPAATFAGLQGRAPANVHLVRQRSAWNNSDLLVQILGALSAVLAPYLHELQPIFLMDACRVHITQPVLRACWRGKLWPVIVPAKLTWLLQPCDTHAFMQYKATLKAEYQKARARTADGQLGIDQFLDALYSTIRSTLQGRRWALAFEVDGFGDGQAMLSSYARRQLEYDRPPVVPNALPTAELVQLCFPKTKAASKAAGSITRPMANLCSHGPMPQPLALPAPAAAKALPAPPIARAAPLGLRRLAPPPAPRDGPQTRAQSRLLAASAKGAPPRAAAVGSSSAAPPPAPKQGPQSRAQSLLLAALAKGTPPPPRRRHRMAAVASSSTAEAPV